jgi:uncharacterized membrane protein YdjX (TVP38/TMEM64 family)
VTPDTPTQPPAEPDLDPAEGSSLDSLQQEAAQGLGKERRQILMLVLLVGAFMLAAHFTPLRAWIENAREWKQQLRGYGPLAPILFFLLTAGAVMLGIPRLTLAATGGLLFGFTEGFILSLTGSTLGSYGTFLLIRKGFKKAVSPQVNSRPWIARLLRRPSLLKVFWVRQLALPGLVLNAALGLADIRHRIFLGGTLLGYIPLNLAATLVGSGLGKQDLQQTMVQLLAAIAVINLIAWLIWKATRPRTPSPQSKLTPSR